MHNRSWSARAHEGRLAGLLPAGTRETTATGAVAANADGVVTNAGARKFVAAGTVESSESTGVGKERAQGAPSKARRRN